MKHVIAVTIAALLALAAPARAQGIAFPADANIKSVRDFGAKGDGVTDDTAAIAAAVKGIGGSHMRSLYFPDGTYLVSDTVLFAEWIFVQGQSTARTRIKLKDSCAGFGDAAKPKPVVCTLAGGGKGSGTMNMNFSTHMLNFTIDTGKGNPGAVGIEFMSHNGGGLEDIVIRSSDGSGPIGLDMRRAGQGPALCRRLVMEGFDVGVWTGPSVYASTFEDMTIRGQKLAGWKNNNHPCTVRKLTSDNKVPMYVQDHRR